MSDESRSQRAKEFAEDFQRHLAEMLALDPDERKRQAAESEARRVDYDPATGCGRYVDMGQLCCRANPCGSCDLERMR